MRGAVLPGERRVELRNYEVPVPGPGQVLVRTRASGLCGSDLRAIYRPSVQGNGPEAYRGVIAGHEPAGVIETIGPDVEGWAAGDRVLLYHIVGCGDCDDCRAGWMISCTSDARAAYGWQRDGGHADFILAEARTLVALPPELSFVDGALVACGFGTSYAACLRAGIAAGETVLVTGLGPVGLGTAMIARAMGANVIGVEANVKRAEVARGLGVGVVLAAADGTLEDVRERTAGMGVEVAIDCSAAQGGRDLTLTALRRWGRAVWVGEGGSFTFEPSPALIHHQLTLNGSWVCSVQQMRELVGLLVKWGTSPEAIVTNRLQLDEVERAYREFDSGMTGKIVLTWPE
ncbi:MAG: zinc-binding dehydrogenase [Candidatus Dormibacteria bacterium]